MSFRSPQDQEAAVQVLELVGLAGGIITRYPPGELPRWKSGQGAAPIGDTPCGLMDCVARELHRAADTPALNQSCWLTVLVPDEYLAGWVIETVRATATQCIHTCHRVTVDALIEGPHDSVATPVAAAAQRQQPLRRGWKGPVMVVVTALGGAAQVAVGPPQPACVVLAPTPSAERACPSGEPLWFECGLTAIVERHRCLYESITHRVDRGPTRSADTSVAG